MIKSLATFVTSATPSAETPSPTMDDEMKDYTPPDLAALKSLVDHFDEVKLVAALESGDKQAVSDAVNWLRIIAHSSNTDYLSTITQALRTAMTSSGPTDHFNSLKADQHVNTCGYVFKSGEWGYQCQQCQEDDTSILCEPCFKDSDHNGHEFTRARTGGGGCCDCGDSDSWKESGFCTQHRDVMETDETVYAPLIKIGGEDRVALCERILGILLDIVLAALTNACPKAGEDNIFQGHNHYLYNAIRDRSYMPGRDEYGVMIYNDEVNSFEGVIGFLRDAIPALSRVNALNYAHYVHMNERCVIYVGTLAECTKVIDKIRTSSRVETTNEGVVSCRYLKTSITRNYQVLSFDACSALFYLFSQLTPILAFKRMFCNLMMRPIGAYHGAATPESCRLTSFFSSFQVLPMASQETLKNWLFSLTFDRSFKNSFSMCFTKTYPQILNNFIKDIFEVNTSLLSLSVQIFTIPLISTYLAEEHNVLDIFFNYLKEYAPSHFGNESNDILTYDTKIKNMYSFERFKHAVVDLHYILSIKPILRNALIKNANSIEPWLQVLALFHLANENVRNVDFEETSWVTYFNVGSFMMKNNFSMLSSLIPEVTMSPSTQDELGYNNAILALLNAASQIRVPEIGGGVSFHLPIHRSIAFLLLIGVRHYKQHDLAHYAPTLFANKDIAKALLRGPASIDNFVGEHEARMWQRNGPVIHSQIFNYSSHAYLRYYFVEHDLFLKQVLLCVLGANSFLESYIASFPAITTRVFDTISALNHQEAGVLSSFFHHLLTVLTERATVGEQSFDDILANDLVHSLFAKGKTFSKLNTGLGIDQRVMTLTPRDVERVLATVSIFKAPTTLSDQGRYELRPEMAARYNRYYFRYTNEEREKAEEANRLALDRTTSTAPPPVRRIPAAHLAPLKPQFSEITATLESPLLFRIVFHALYQCVVELPEQSTATTTEDSTTTTTETSKPIVMDDFDIQQRRVSRSDTIDHLLHLLMLAIDVNPTDQDRLARIQTMASDCSRSPSNNVSIVSLLKAMQTDSSKKFFHSTVIHLISRLDASSSSNTIENEEQCSLRTSSSNEDDDKQRRMMEAKRKVMEQFARQQRTFTLSMDGEDYEDEDMANDKEEEKETCILCRDQLQAQDTGNPIGHLCLVQRTRLAQVMSERVNMSPEYYLMVPGSGGQSQSTPKLNSASPLARPYETVIQYCGHSMHFKCFESMDKTKKNITCPLCQSISNAIMPAIPKKYSVFSDQSLVNVADIKDTKLASCFAEFGKKVITKLGSYRSLISVLQSAFDHHELTSRNNNWSLILDEKSLDGLRKIMDSVSIYMATVGEEVETLDMTSVEGDAFGRVLSKCIRSPVSVAEYIERSVAEYQQTFTSLELTDQTLLERIVYLRKIAILDRIYNVARSLPIFGMDGEFGLCSSYLTHLVTFINNQELRRPCQFVQLDEQVTATSTLSNGAITRFSVVQLPEKYDDIFSSTIKCLKCKTLPIKREQAICLLCGRMVCAGSDCCKDNGTGEISSHARTCGGDIGVYILVEHSILLVVFDGSIGFLGSPYLDTHGEEDSGLTRGVSLL
eukprot:gene7652-8956_t